MKILYIYQFLTYGGVEMLLSRRCREFKKYNPEISIGLLVSESFMKEIPADFDQVYITKDKGEIRKILNEYDLIIDIDTPSLFKVIEQSKKPLIIECHSSSPDSRKYVKKNLPTNLKTIIVPSLSFKKVISKEIAQKDIPIECVYNFVNKEISNKNAKLCINFVKSRPMLWVGRLEESKDWLKAIRILRILLNQYHMDNIELFFLGKVPAVYKKSFIELIKDEKVLSHVRYLSEIDFELMQDIYSSVFNQRGIYLSTSKYETFGLAVVEAMTSGLPCVLNNLEVFKEISSSSSIIFKNEKIAAKEIYEIVKDDNLWENFSKKSIKRSKDFRPKEIIQKLFNLYEEALT